MLFSLLPGQALSFEAFEIGFEGSLFFLQLLDRRAAFHTAFFELGFALRFCLGKLFTRLVHIHLIKKA